MDSILLIAFDVDGTLTKSKVAMDKEMSELLCRLLGQKKVIIASGSSFEQFKKQFINNLSCDQGRLQNLYLMPTDGASIYEYKEGWQPLYRNDLTPSEKKKVFDAFEKALKEVGFERPEKVYGVLIEDRGSEVAFSALGSEAPLSLKEVWDKDHSKRERIVKALKPEIPDFFIQIGGTTTIEVTKKGIDKAYGLQRIMDYLKISPQYTAYVGDALFPGGNDESVLRLDIKHIPVKGPEETAELIKSWLATTS